MGEGNAMSPAEERRRHQHHVGIIEDVGPDADAQELVGDVPGDLRRAADTVEIALARPEIRSAARSNASASRIASVSSRAWIEVRKTFS